MPNNLLKYINEVIENGKDQIDVDKVIEYINLENLELSDKNRILKKVYSYNYKLTQKLANEVIELNAVGNVENFEIANIKLHEPLLSKTTIKKNLKTIKKIKLDNYIELIESFNDSSEFANLSNIIDDEIFAETINQLLMHYVLELVTLKKLKFEDKDNVFNDENIKLENIIENLKCLQYSTQKNNLDINNNLIYLITKSGNISFLNSLNKILPEYYESIYIAFNSIYNGSFKSMKRVGKSSDGFDSPLLEVKDKQIRIFYLKISENLYLIIDVMVKQCQNSKMYSDYIRRIAKEASIQKKIFLDMNPEEKENLLNQHNSITSDIYEILEQKKRVLK